MSVFASSKISPARMFYIYYAKVCAIENEVLSSCLNAHDSAAFRFVCL
jgi:hypothetical protein